MSKTQWYQALVEAWKQTLLQLDYGHFQVLLSFACPWPNTCSCFFFPIRYYQWQLPVASLAFASPLLNLVSGAHGKMK